MQGDELPLWRSSVTTVLGHNAVKPHKKVTYAGRKYTWQPAMEEVEEEEEVAVLWLNIGTIYFYLCVYVCRTNCFYIGKLSCGVSCDGGERIRTARLLSQKQQSS